MEPLAQSTSRSQQEFSLPSPDQGRAWFILIGNMLTDALIWGFPWTFGVFQEYYSKLDDFRGSRSAITTVGTVCLAVMYLIAPISLLFVRLFPRSFRTSMWIGVGILCLSLLGASFASQVWHLILTQGVLYAIGGSMISFPALAIVDQWFVHRKGTAFGISWAGTSIGCLILPYLLSWSLNQFGFRTTLRWWALLNIVWLGPMVFLFRYRIPPAATTRFARPDLTYIFRQPFSYLLLGIILQGFGHFLPGIYLPSYTQMLSMDQVVATTSIAICNVGTIVGTVSSGFLIDHWSFLGTASLSLCGAMLSITTLWGLAGTPATVCAFAFTYGFCTGAFTATWPGIVRATVQKHPSAEPGLAYMFLLAGRGVGNLFTGPIASALLHIKPLAHNINFGYGSDYSAVIVFCAFTMLSGMAGLFNKIHIRQMFNTLHRAV